MPNQSPLFIVPSSTELSCSKVRLQLYCPEGISRRRLIKEGRQRTNAKWAVNPTFYVDTNGRYAVEVETLSGNLLRRTFSILFLNSRPSFAGGNGSASSPYLIETAAQLNAIREDLTAHYKLIADIDLSNADWGLCWCPIGWLHLTVDNTYANDPGIGIDHDAAFSGCLDGAMHTIKNMTEVSPFKAQEKHMGLFGYLEGTVKYLFLENAFLSGSVRTKAIGGIAGYFHGTISACCVTGELQGRHLVGGIVGEIFDNVTEETAVISECEFLGSINSQMDEGIYAQAIGGIAAEDGSSSSIENCAVCASMESAHAIYGICGYTPQKIINCIVRGQIETNNNSRVYGIGSAYSWTNQSWNPFWGVYGCVCAWSNISFTESTAEWVKNTAFMQLIGCPPDDMEPPSGSCNLIPDTHIIKASGTPVAYTIKQPFERECGALSAELLSDLGWDFCSIWGFGQDGYPYLKWKGEA